MDILGFPLNASADVIYAPQADAPIDDFVATGKSAPFLRQVFIVQSISRVGRSRLLKSICDARAKFARSRHRWMQQASELRRQMSDIRPKVRSVSDVVYSAVLMTPMQPLRQYCDTVNSEHDRGTDF